MDEIRFDGRVALVTGAGGGMGRAYALELGRRGARVVVNDLGGQTDGTGSGRGLADKTVELITGAGGEAIANYDSVAKPEGGQAIIDAALDGFGRVDIVIHNAGILRDDFYPEMKWSDMDLVLDVHLKGGFYVSQPAFKAMQSQGYGRFLFVSSLSGLIGNRRQAAYAAAKMGLVGLSNVLALEGKEHGILSNCLAPTANTRMLGNSEALEDRFGAAWISPLVVYLVSEQNRVTHETYEAGGNNYARMFMGVTPGWQSERQPRVEDIAARFEKIRQEQGYRVPDDAMDELRIMGLFDE